MLKTCDACGEKFEGKTRTTCTPCKNRQWYIANREHALEVRKAWREKNPDYWNKDEFRQGAVERHRHSYFGGLWHVTMERDNQTCQDCGVESESGQRGDQLCVHHIDGNCQHNVLANLVVLCNSCHAKRHYRQGDFPALPKCA